MSISMEFTRRFSMAHRFINSCSKKCMNIHGHNEFVIIEVKEKNGANTVMDQNINMLAEFTSAKSKWHEWVDNFADHATYLNSEDKLVNWITENHPGPRLVVTPGDPTTEIMAILFMAKVNTFLKETNIECTKITLEETPTNTIIFEGSPYEHISPDSKYWWNRNDFSTNDLLNGR